MLDKKHKDMRSSLSISESKQKAHRNHPPLSIGYFGEEAKAPNANLVGHSYKASRSLFNENIDFESQALIDDLDRKGIAKNPKDESKTNQPSMLKNINNYMESAEFRSLHKSHTYENFSEDDVVSFENFGKQLNISRNDEVL